MLCMKCGGTGLLLNNKPCDCGVEVVKEEVTTPKERLIPEIYRGSSKQVGVSDIVVGELDKKKTFNTFLHKLAKDMAMSSTGHPSLFIDLSDTPMGAYEVYYALVEVIVDLVGDLPDHVRDMIRVNELDGSRLRKSEDNLRKGLDTKNSYNFIISDFPLSRYPTLGDYVKVFEPKNATYQWKYPLNMYVVKVKNKIGGI